MFCEYCGQEADRRVTVKRIHNNKSHSALSCSACTFVATSSEAQRHFCSDTGVALAKCTCPTHRA